MTQDAGTKMLPQVKSRHSDRPTAETTLLGARTFTTEDEFTQNMPSHEKNQAHGKGAAQRTTTPTGGPNSTAKVERKAPRIPS